MKNLLPNSICGAVFALFSVSNSNAQIKGDPQMQGNLQQLSVPKSSSKLSTALTKLQDNFDPNLQSKGKPGSPPTDALQGLMQVRGDKVIVDFTVKDNLDAAKAELQKFGVTIIAAYDRVISGIVPIASLSKLGSAVTIQYAKPALKPRHQSLRNNILLQHNISNSLSGIPAVNPVISQGDTAQYSYVARKKYNVSGSGVKVGILSDSYDNLGGAATGVAKGELPGPGNPVGYMLPVDVLEDNTFLDGSDEGRGMAEIVHDVAPGAELAFHTAFISEPNFAQGIQDLANKGCKVIVDDVIYYDEPYFQDGYVAQSVDIARKKGVAYFSSAGNAGVDSYESVYRPTRVEPFGTGAGTAHNFSAPGTTPRYFQPLYVPSGGVIILAFQWDQSFFSASGVGPDSDYDIFLTDIFGNTVAASFDNNFLTGEPSEIIGYYNNTKNFTFFLTIVKYSGPDTRRLKYLLYGNAQFYLTNNPIPGIFAPSLVGHAKADGAIAVAAAWYLQTPAYKSATPLAEYFTSKGGVANYLDKNGKRIPALLRFKPNFTAPDGGNTSFFPPGGDISQDVDTYPNFFGTSAAAPHAAGVAALIIEAQGKKSITAFQIREALATTAIDMDDNYTPGFDKGFDFLTGTGLINADLAVGKARAANGISSVSNAFVSAERPAITEQKNIALNSAEVYPNPSGRSFKVSLSLPNQQKTNIELFSIDGKKLMSKTVYQSKGVMDIDASAYKPGVYLLNIKQGSFTKTIRLIKQ